MQTNLDKAFNISLDVANRRVIIPEPLIWYVTDENIAHIRCQVIDETEGNIVDIENYSLKIRILTPNNLLYEKDFTLNDSVFEFTLTEELIVTRGKYDCELSVEYFGDVLTSEPFKYRIIESIANKLDSNITSNTHYPLILELEDKFNEVNNILDDQINKVIILNNDVTLAEKTRQANEAQRIADEAIRAEFYNTFNERLSQLEEMIRNLGGE